MSPLNPIRIEQLPPAANRLPHRTTPKKLIESAPETDAKAKFENVIVDRPVFVSVTSWNSVVPIYTLPKFTGDGEIRSVEPETLFTFCVTLADVLDANFVSPE